MNKVELSDLKNQLARMKEDLDRFVARKPTGLVVEPLRERIRQTEALVAEGTRRLAEDRKSLRDSNTDSQADPSAGMLAASGRVRPRRMS
ncbi:MAG TPA: hypothetical protein HPQ04_08390 [Rhodospirillaceae bacterium]|nr:hypothetical protein [Rhodospirillaceae bacterium]